MTSLRVLALQQKMYRATYSSWQQVQLLKMANSCVCNLMLMILRVPCCAYSEVLTLRECPIHLELCMMAEGATQGAREMRLA